MTHDDLTPDLEDVLQEDPPHVPMTPIPVVVEGQTDVRHLPTTAPGMTTYDLTEEPVRVLQDDPRRSRALLSPSAVIVVGTSQAACRHAGATVQPALLTLTTSGEVWARADTGTATLGVINEQWAR